MVNRLARMRPPPLNDRQFLLLIMSKIFKKSKKKNLILPLLLSPFFSFNHFFSPFGGFFGWKTITYIVYVWK